VLLERRIIDGNDHLEVSSVFDAIVPLVAETDYCLIGLTSNKLAEEWFEDNEDGTESVSYDAILGRACGDRVCIVQSTECSISTLLATCSHEALHCFGFDHCTTFQCLMNSQSIEDDDCLFLSPLNLKKWVVGVLGIRGDDEAATKYVLERYAAMVEALESLGLVDEVPWLRNKIRAIGLSAPKARARKRQCR